MTFVSSVLRSFLMMGTLLYFMYRRSTEPMGLGHHLFNAVFWLIWLGLFNKLLDAYSGPDKFWGWFIGAMAGYIVIRTWLPMYRQHHREPPTTEVAPPAPSAPQDAPRGPEDSQDWGPWSLSLIHISEPTRPY